MLFWFARDPENRIVGSGKADALVVGYEGDLDALVGEELVRIGQSVVGYGWVLDDCPVPQVVDLEVRGFGTDVAISLGDREVARDNGATIQLAPGFVGVRGTHKGAFVRPDGTEWIAATKPGKSGIGCERLVLVSRKVRPFPCKHRFSFERFEHPTLGSRKRWICAVCRWTGPPDYQPEPGPVAPDRRDPAGRAVDQHGDERLDLPVRNRQPAVVPIRTLDRRPGRRSRPGMG